MPHQGSVWDGQFSGDGKLVVTSDFNGTATLWDVQEVPRRLGAFAVSHFQGMQDVLGLR